MRRKPSARICAPTGATCATTVVTCAPTNETYARTGAKRALSGPSGRRSPSTTAVTEAVLEVEEKLFGADAQRAAFKRPLDAVRFSVGRRDAVREIDDLVRPHWIADGIAHDHDTRLQPPRSVLRDDDAYFTTVQFNNAAEGKDADAADELLDEIGIEQGATAFIEDVEGVRRRERLRVGSLRRQRIESIDDAGHRADETDVAAFE